ncbi:DNA replication/repair protein RecF [Pseudoclavibacter sp. CFCC 14310]|uniref:DNA replication/repair protein RecF n=1 Tax=Pseudoclavibacter sp. CFCC 14310 TaxID=2615180 RepID=UPI001300E074|nr:DNA replication/repair protein RecF [Pseudoclavibacter sp. CFCC 14310]KAB1647078.1 DNA replication/repair protein RecF [Pseudoclavibacter sp. CFCC 14310]
MYVQSLQVHDFRNYTRAELTLGPQIWVFAGRNGQGKTNLVEAVRYLSVFGSHRVSNNAPMVRAGQRQAVVRATVLHEGRQLQIDAQLNLDSPNRIRINRAPKRVGEAQGQFSTVLFAPEDLALVKGGPEVRRRALDELCVGTRARFTETLGDYERVLRQRNTLLKSARAARTAAAGLNTLDIWDEQLVDLGAQLLVQRADLVARLVEPLNRLYDLIADTDARATAQLVTNTVADRPGDLEHVRSAFADRLRAARDTDLDRGVTTVGPHRDDLLLSINDLPAREYASHGESWSLALALRLAGAEALRLASPAGDPVLILDDVFAELDSARRSRLIELAAGYEQVLITAAVLDDVPSFGDRETRTVHVAHGELTGDGVVYGNVEGAPADDEHPNAERGDDGRDSR